MKNKQILIVAICLAVITGLALKFKSEVIIYPAPEGEVLSGKYTVTADGKNVPVYTAKVASSDRTLRYKAMDDKINSANYFDEAAFCYFDLSGSTTVTLKSAIAVKTVKILPSSYQIKPILKDGLVSFTIKAGQQITLEINGEIIQSLHIFANTIEKNKPNANDPNVIFYGPGIHEISRLILKDNQTLYLAGGAILRCVIGEKEIPYTTPANESKNKAYPPSINLIGKNIKVRGRGIIDASACPTHSRNMILVQGENISIEGIILRDASLWTVPVRGSANVHIDNIKLLGYRANSDGIDICNSSDVLVENCFIRTLDDLVVVKSIKGKGDTKNITVRKCVLWNEVAHALSVGAEINENIHNVLFTDCDVIHDQGREWSLRVYHCDGGYVSDIRFENLRIEESKRFISLWINKDVWTTDEHRGHIDNISFQNITAKGTPLSVELLGYGKSNLVNQVDFKNIIINGKKLTAESVKKNEFVTNVNFK